ncbi:MAG: hypothetical protein Q8M12_06600, partial [bacterium]|nr:hypothetical protein [bacterium]
AGLSQSCINGAVMSRQMSKSAERRLAKIKNQGLYEGCTVQMSNTGKLREIKSITHDGRILMKGAERVCSPSDCTLVK